MRVGGDSIVLAHAICQQAILNYHYSLISGEIEARKKIRFKKIIVKLKMAAN